MPTILGANSVSGYEISNSLRTANASAEVLQKTLSGNGNRRTFTYSGWLKKSYIQVNADPYPSQYVFFSQAGSNSNDGLRFVPDGNKLGFLGQNGGSTTFSLTASASFRDPSAWLHIVAAVDTTQGTAANRVKLYVNGVQLTTFDQAIYPSENLDTNINTNGVSHRFQGQIDTNTNYFRGYGSEIHFIDGAAKAPTDFGEFDDNGVWIPKAYTGSYGTHGVYFEFKQTGTSANASGMGADTSGNDNHYTPTNLTADSVTTDTPTNNFCTMNPLHSEGMTFSEGNLDILAATSNWNIALGTIAIPNSGKWYMEAKIIAVQASGHNTVGFLDSNYPFGSNDTATGFTGGGGAWLTYAYFHAANDNAYVNSADGTAYQFENNTTFKAGVNDIVSLAFDRDNDKVWFGLNGVYAKANGTTGANPSTGADATIVSVQENSVRTYMPMMAAGNSSARQQWNFGNAPHAISSGNADANGYGNFEYAVPTGFYSLCTKNLAEFG